MSQPPLMTRLRRQLTYQRLVPLLAVASGAVASGLGYVVWFAALRGLAASSAATVQLSVPVIAAAGGALLLAEPLTPRLAVSAALTLGGIALVLRRRRG